MKALLAKVLMALLCGVGTLIPGHAAPLSGQIIVDPDSPAWLKYQDGARSSCAARETRKSFCIVVRGIRMVREAAIKPL